MTQDLYAVLYLIMSSIEVVHFPCSCFSAQSILPLGCVICGKPLCIGIQLHATL